MLQAAAAPTECASIAAFSPAVKRQQLLRGAVQMQRCNASDRRQHFTVTVHQHQLHPVPPTTQLQRTTTAAPPADDEDGTDDDEGGDSRGTVVHIGTRGAAASRSGWCLSRALTALGSGMTSPDGRGAELELSLARCATACGVLWSVVGVPATQQSSWSAPPAPLPGAAQAARPKPGRLLCWVQTHAAVASTRAAAVRDTWGSGCDTLLFVTDREVPGLPVLVVKLPGNESRELLWDKAKQAWSTLADRFLDRADWFLKADDDTYVVTEHLRARVADLDPETAVYYGRVMRHGGLAAQPFVAGGSGELLSRAAVRALGQALGRREPGVFRTEHTYAEDLELGLSLRRMVPPVQATDAVDAAGRALFLPIGTGIEQLLYRNQGAAAAAAAGNSNGSVHGPGPIVDAGWWRYCPAAREGPGCCSPSWITTHYVEPHEMRLLHTAEALRCDPPQGRWPFLELLRPAAPPPQGAK